MKKVLFIIAVLLPLFAGAQWQQIPQGDIRTGLLGVGGENNVFLAPSEAWAIPNRYIYYNYNQGSSGSIWDSTYSGYQYEIFYDIDFVNDSVGFICGGGWFTQYRDLIIRTTDAGKTWETIAMDSLGGGGYVFSNIDFMNIDSGFVYEGYGPLGLLRTTNGGNSWDTLSIDTAYQAVSDIFFVNESVGFVTTSAVPVRGKKSRVYKTTDFGDTWEVVYEHIDSASLLKMYFVDENIGYVCGEKGSFLKTIDGGATWNVQYLPGIPALTAMYFVSAEEGYLNINGGIYKTIDGGSTWREQQMSSQKSVSEIIFTPDGAVGYLLADGYLFKTSNGGGPTGIQSMGLSDQIILYPNPASEYIRLENKSRVSINAVVLYSTSGREVKRFPNENITLDVADIKSGLYILRIATDEGFIDKKLYID